jgi:heme-degrading monooxygenase HmoA
MYVLLWRFRPLMGREREFERAYGPSGEWARLFERGEGYLGTELLQRSEDPREYLAVDRWASGAAYDAFRARKMPSPLANKCAYNFRSASVPRSR